MSGTSSNEKYGKRKGTSSTKPERASWRGFVRCDLNDGQKDDLRENPFPLSDIFTFLNQYTADQHKFTLSHDSGNSTFIASLTDQALDSENAGLTITGRGNTAGNAIQSLMYKVLVILKDTPWSTWGTEHPTQDFG